MVIVARHMSLGERADLRYIFAIQWPGLHRRKELAMDATYGTNTMPGWNYMLCLLNSMEISMPLAYLFLGQPLLEDGFKKSELGAVI